MSQQHAIKYWRSLDELENTPEFQQFLSREFPIAASEYPEGVSRRRWMQLMGASFALASVAGCRWETEKFAPFLHRPEGYVPGKPTTYATTIEWAGAPQHLLMTCYDGRPIKVEGNPEHPGSLGATNAMTQAATLALYDPDRSQRPAQLGEGRSTGWEAFDSYFDERIKAARDKQGAGLAILLEPTRSLSIGAQLDRIASELPQAKIYEYTPLANVNEAAGIEAAFGQPLDAHYKLADAKVIASLDADLLNLHPNAVKYARDWAASREVDAAHPEQSSMSRVYAIESQFSQTGTVADHRLPLKSGLIGQFAKELRDQIKTRLDGGEVPQPAGDATSSNLLAQGALPTPTRQQILYCLVDDLVANQGAGVVVAGAAQPAAVHALVCEINTLLGNIGQTITYTEPLPVAKGAGTIADLVQQIGLGGVDTLLIVGGNPVYDAPADLDFAAVLGKVPHSIHLSYYDDETSRACTWQMPACHPFEAWGDAVSWEGIVSVAQPLIEPLIASRSPLEVLAKLAGNTAKPQLLVGQALNGVLAQPLTKDGWKKLLHDGFGGESILKPVTPSLASELPEVAGGNEDDLEVVFTPSSSVYDGRFANNAWLQETPDFITKVCWDNVARLAPATAERLGVEQGDMLRVDVGGKSYELPVFMLPGQARNSIGIELGYGRISAGQVGGSRYQMTPSMEAEIVGVSVYPARTTTSMFVAKADKAVGTGKKAKLALTQDHFAIDTVGLEMIGRRVGQLVREAPIDFYKEQPDFAQHMVHEVKTDPLWPAKDYSDVNKWGMAIDLNKCTGCNACMVACQSENNVPVVGKEQVFRGREMHWIRIDRYFAGAVDNPQVSTQPLTCQQCETAPCEQVCPVAATIHSDEGLNDMVYNRCIGTRYCANNCPYKVRRFNYFHYTGYLEEASQQLQQLVLNPEVTVRSRGVMEKCTYCVQRIAAARIPARAENRPIADGEVKTACQQACPTQAIAFGDLNDEQSVVAAKHADPRAYGLLTELDTRPRTLYLAKIRNPHPLLANMFPVPHVIHHHGHDGGHGEGDHKEGHEDKDHKEPAHA
jgi:molybdopterin-containing oxidoreductase family iron-sulfur binding subunit